MDISEMLARDATHHDREAGALRLEFERLCWACRLMEGTNPDDDDANDRIVSELFEVTKRIIHLSATSLEALRAKATMAYFWSKNGAGPIEVTDADAASGFEALAGAFCPDFKSTLDAHYASIAAALQARRDAQPSAQIAL